MRQLFESWRVAFLRPRPALRVLDNTIFCLVLLIWYNAICNLSLGMSLATPPQCGQQSKVYYQTHGSNRSVPRYVGPP